MCSHTNTNHCLLYKTCSSGSRSDTTELPRSQLPYKQDSCNLLPIGQKKLVRAVGPWAWTPLLKKEGVTWEGMLWSSMMSTVRDFMMEGSLVLAITSKGLRLNSTVPPPPLVIGEMMRGCFLIQDREWLSEVLTCNLSNTSIYFSLDAALKIIRGRESSNSFFTSFRFTPNLRYIRWDTDPIWSRAQVTTQLVGQQLQIPRRMCLGTCRQHPYSRMR